MMKCVYLHVGCNRVSVVEIDGIPYKASYAAIQRSFNSEKLFVTTVRLASGEHTIVLKGEHFEGKQFLRPMQINLE